MFRYARFLSAYALLAALASGGVAHAQDEVRLIQAGDGEMSCEALAAEINRLTTGQAKAAKRAQSGKKLFGLATTALQAAGPALSGGVGRMGGGGMGALMAQQAVGQMQAQAMQQQMGGGYDAEPAPAADSVESQRLTRLTDLHGQKGC